MGEYDLEYDLAASGVLDVMTTPGQDSDNFGLDGEGIGPT